MWYWRESEAGGQVIAKGEVGGFAGEAGGTTVLLVLGPPSTRVATEDGGSLGKFKGEFWGKGGAGRAPKSTHSKYHRRGCLSNYVLIGAQNRLEVT